MPSAIKLSGEEESLIARLQDKYDIENRGTFEVPFGYVYHTTEDGRLGYMIDRDAGEIKFADGNPQWDHVFTDREVLEAQVLLLWTFDANLAEEEDEDDYTSEDAIEGLRSL